MTTNSTTYEAGTIVHVAPTELLLQRNIREAKPSPDLIKSVKEVGVLEPITAVTTEAGHLLVRYGHRRTLAAVEAQAATVPVYITGPDDEANEAEVLRVIAQRDENTHRTGLTTADEVGVVEQLTAFGLTAAQITKKARIKRANVDAALTVAGSGLARKATEKYDKLTLDQVVTVAEFEDDPETAKALIVAAHEGKFDHVAQRARDDRADAQATAAVLADLEAQNVTVIEHPSYDDGKRILSLDRLVTTADRATREDIEAVAHAQCPGHVAWIGNEWCDVDSEGNPIQFPEEPAEDADQDTWDAYEEECDRVRNNARRVSLPVAIYGCNEWKNHGHHDRYDYGGGTSGRTPVADMSDEEREAAKAQRKLIIESNKAWASAQPVRRSFLESFAKAKTPPKGTGRFLAEHIARDSHIGTAPDLAAQWLGIKKADTYGRVDLSPAKSATENKCVMIALVQVLAAYEDDLSDNSWRHDGTSNATGRYLRFIQAGGYTLSDVEKYAISKKTA